MTKYFAGNSLAAFKRSSAAIVESTTAGRFNSTYVSSSILISNLSAYLETPTFGPATGTIWIRADSYLPAALANTTARGIELWNGSTGVFRIIGVTWNNTSTLKCQYWNGSAWTDTGSSFTASASSLVTLVAKVVLGSSFEVYLAGSLVASGSGWSGGGTQVDRAILHSWTTQSANNYAEVMIADYDIRDAHLMQKTLTGDSATNTGAASGSYTDVNETALDDTTLINVSTSGNKAGQTKASVSVPGGYTIAAMVVSARGRVTSPITDGKLGIRSGSTNYSSSGKSYSGGFEPRQRIDETDPATSSAWTLSNFNNAEIYLEAA